HSENKILVAEAFLRDQFSAALGLIGSAGSHVITASLRGQYPPPCWLRLQAEPPIRLHTPQPIPTNCLVAGLRVPWPTMAVAQSDLSGPTFRTAGDTAMSG